MTQPGRQPDPPPGPADGADRPQAELVAGIPSRNTTLYHRARFVAHDPAAWVRLPDGQTVFVLRDIEVARARQRAKADEVLSPAEVLGAGGLPVDREEGIARAAAELLRRGGATAVRADRTLSLIHADACRRAGLAVVYDPAMGIDDRRAKDERELAEIREVQAVTERAIRLACELIAAAQADREGVLILDGEPLTSERVRAAASGFLVEHGCRTGVWIVAGGPQGGDCHDVGSGPLRTAEPVIVDIFPRSERSRYCGDGTRCVVHGAERAGVPDLVAQMHTAVVAAKRSAIAAVRAGVAAAEVHRAAMAEIRRAGFDRGLPPGGAGENGSIDFCSMQHGTGHGLGLDVHEPPLLDDQAAGPSPELVAADVITVEPGLYRPGVGGIRIEDVVVVGPEGCENLSTLPEGLAWA